MKILIADDDPISRKVLQRTLTKRGYEVISARDGREAWEIIHTGHIPGMAILDWIMPGYDGPTLVQKIRELRLSNYMFIILLTAKSEKEDIIKGIEAGADDYLTKPFNRGELFARLRAGERILNLEKNLAEKNKTLQEANREIQQKNLRMQRDLEAAAAIQKTLLPNHVPELQNLAIDWLYEPCDELAGDTLNVFQLDEHHLGLYVLDVSGHGVSAALLSVTLSRILVPQDGPSGLLTTQKPGETAARHITPPAKVARELNRRFQIDLNTAQYFTLIYGVLDLRTNVLTYVCAGHPGPIVLSPNDEVRKLNHAGMPIGFSQEETYREQSLALQPGDRLYLYSDGLTEAMNETGAQFGLERVIHLLRETKTQSLKTGLLTILASVEKWTSCSLKDDISILALEVLR